MNTATTRSRLEHLIQRFSRTRILVLGDYILDQYLLGHVRRISPEAPVPIVELEGEGEFRPGGAGNAVRSLARLGAAVEAVGVVGSDEHGTTLIDILRESGVSPVGIIRDHRRCTPLKTRVIATPRHHQVVRLDREKVEPVSPSSRERMRDRIQKRIPRVDAVVISDYGKGTVTRELVGGVVRLAKRGRIPVGVDPKPRNFSCYRGVDFLTPNHHEASQIVGFDVEEERSVRAAGERIIRETGCSLLLITRGEAGMNLFEAPRSRRKGRTRVTRIFTGAREVFDVTGAGDTVIALFSLALAAGAVPREAALLASIAAGAVVAKPGTASVDLEELKEELAQWMSTQSR